MKLEFSPDQLVSYREATKRHAKMDGVTLGGRRYCGTCKTHKPLVSGYKRLPTFKCADCCAKEQTNVKTKE